MRAIAWCGVGLAVVLLGGCSSEKNGKNGKAENAKLSIGLPEKKTVLNGNQASLPAALTWSGGKEEVRLSVSVTPVEMGVTAKVEPAVVKPADEQSAKVIVTVGESAASGSYQVKLTGRSSSGEASGETTITVPKKE
jgi:uncharacterized membrane protein